MCQVFFHVRRPKEEKDFSCPQRGKISTVNFGYCIYSVWTFKKVLRVLLLGYGSAVGHGIKDAWIRIKFKNQ